MTTRTPLLSAGHVPLLLAANVPTTNFYVVVHNGPAQHGVLLGPYVTTQEAIDMVPSAERLAEGVDGYAVFYLFTVMRLTTNKPGKLQHMLQAAS